MIKPLDSDIIFNIFTLERACLDEEIVVEVEIDNGSSKEALG